MRTYSPHLITIAFLISLGGCGTLSAHDANRPASHHAQRKYDDAVRKGAAVPADQGREEDRPRS